MTALTGHRQVARPAEARDSDAVAGPDRRASFDRFNSDPDTVIIEFETPRFVNGLDAAEYDHRGQISVLRSPLGGGILKRRPGTSTLKVSRDGNAFKMRPS